MHVYFTYHWHPYDILKIRRNGGGPRILRVKCLFVLELADKSVFYHNILIEKQTHTHTHIVSQLFSLYHKWVIYEIFSLTYLVQILNILNKISTWIGFKWFNSREQYKPRRAIWFPCMIFQVAAVFLQTARCSSRWIPRTAASAIYIILANSIP